MGLVIILFLIAIINFFEIKSMWKKKLKKEMVIFICFSLFTVLISYFYMVKPLKESFSHYTLRIFTFRK